MLYYVGTVDVPSKKANAIQQVRMCQALQQNGIDVCLVLPRFDNKRENPNWESLAEFYGLETEFEVVSVPTLNPKSDLLPQLGVASMAGGIALWLISRVIKGKLDGDDIIYGRNYYGMFLFTEFSKLLPESRRPIIAFEIHTPISAHLKQRFFRSVDGVVTITNRLKRYLSDPYHIEKSKILVAPDGVDLELYEELALDSPRDKLGIPHAERIVAYTGHLYPGKGAELLVEAAKNLEATVYIVGGYDDDIERIKREVGNPENVVFVGFVEPHEVPAYQIAADVLVAPYTEQSRPWVSPLKIFEYMAAKKPIVASDRRVLKEVLTDRENAIIFPMGDVHALRASMRLLFNDEKLANRIAKQSGKDINQYTWKQRAGKVLAFLSDENDIH